MVYFGCLFGYAGLCLYNYYRSKRVVNIAFIHSAIWFLLTTLVLVFKLDFTESACLFLFINSALFFIGYSLFPVRLNTTIEFDNNYTRIMLDDEIRRFDKLNWFMIGLSLFGTIYLAYDQGFTISSLSNLSGLVNKMHSVSTSRYASDTFDFSIVN